MEQEPQSQHSLLEANRERGRFSDEENAAGAAGAAANLRDMDKEPFFITHEGDGFGAMRVGLSWNKLHTKAEGLMSLALSLIGKEKSNVDLDLGCLYELKDGSKGCLQAFGDLFGALDERPFIRLSDDERTGKSDGIDEYFTINGTHWPDIQRVLVYAYIYKGVANWNDLKPQCQLMIKDRIERLTLSETTETLPICALFTLENENDMLRVTRRIEYFAGHPEMDRAYGYGLNWEDGSKS